MTPLAVAGIRYIPHLCCCDRWMPPDYRHPPERRTWTLAVPDPSCKMHGREARSPRP